MKIIEADKIIAEFMGTSFTENPDPIHDLLMRQLLREDYYKYKYSKSFDALIKVLKKLKRWYSIEIVINDFGETICFREEPHLKIRFEGSLSLEDTAIATAKSIIYLQKGEYGCFNT